jgi:NADPH-dependent curcumin reductase CurA
MPAPENFALVETDVPDAADGQVLVENLYMSVDPAMRPRLTAGQDLNVAMMGGALGRVAQSRHPDFAVGDLVSNRMGFREHFVSDGKGLTKLNPDPDLPVTAHMHALGMTGFTAYGGLLHIGQLKDGEQVFVSTAAGAVGSVAAQIAKIKGCYVAGSTSSDDKAAWLRDEAGLDAVLNYRTQPLAQAVREAMPKGIDVYFENVGGEHLDAVLPRMNVRGRIPVCGMISTYNGERAGVRNLSSMIYSRVRMEGFVASDFGHLQAQFQADMSGWLKSGRIKYQETVLDGFERAPEALVGLIEGRNTGKMLVRAAA